MLKKKALLFALTSAACLSMSTSASAEERFIQIESSFTMHNFCGAGNGLSSIYIGPNKAHEHGGTCVSRARGTAPWNAELPFKATYTRDSRDCVYAYAGPWKAYEHGGYCLEPRNLQDSLNIYTVPTRDRSQCTGYSVYVGPWKEGEHGGHCLSISYPIH